MNAKLERSLSRAAVQTFAIRKTLDNEHFVQFVAKHQLRYSRNEPFKLLSYLKVTEKTTDLAATQHKMATVSFSRSATKKELRMRCLNSRSFCYQLYFGRRALRSSHGPRRTRAAAPDARAGPPGSSARPRRGEACPSGRPPAPSRWRAADGPGPVARPRPGQLGDAFFCRWGTPEVTPRVPDQN